MTTSQADSGSKPTETRNAELLEAIRKGEAATVARLLDEDPDLVRAATPDVSAMLLARYYGRPEIADIFISHGAVPNFHEACAMGHLDRAKDLLQQDPSLVTTFARDGHSPLGLAAFFGHRALVSLLLDRGADVNAPSRNAQKVAPLHSAVARRDAEIVRLLLDHGADVNAIQERGFTPLHAAAASGDDEIVMMLLQHGADPEIEAADGKTPLDLAREKGHNTTAELLTGSEGM
jgi:ankyrin repeat protein